MGVSAGNFSNERIYPTRWRCRFSLDDGIARTYPWVEAQSARIRLGLLAQPFSGLNQLEPVSFSVAFPLDDISGPLVHPVIFVGVPAIEVETERCHR